MIMRLKVLANKVYDGFVGREWVWLGRLKPGRLRNER